MNDADEKEGRILACCRASVRETDILRLWLAHYRPVVDAMLVLGVVEDGQHEAELEEVCREAGAELVIHRVPIWNCGMSMAALREAVAARPAAWVLHADSDELLAEPGELRAILKQMQSEEADHAMAWMADRLAPGGQLAGLEGIGTVAELEAAFPVRSAVTEGLAQGACVKVCLSRWPQTGDLHQPESGQIKVLSRQLSLEHFKWRSGLKERLQHRLVCYQRAGDPWGIESERVLAELETHGRIRAENWLAPRSRRLHGWMDYEDIYLDAVMAARDGAHFVEVGVWQGRSLCFLAEAMLACGRRLRLDGVDLFRNRQDEGVHYPGELQPLLKGGSWLDMVCVNLRGFGVLDYVNLIQAESTQAAGLYPDGSLDFVWIDAAHDTASVEADCRAWWPKIKPDGGILGGHDYVWESVKQGVHAAGLQGGEFITRGTSWLYRKGDAYVVPSVIPAESRTGGPVCLAMATDARGFEPNATVIASVLRHTERPVHVRMWLRGMTAKSFETGRLRVEFLPAEQGLTGSVPQHVSQSTFDRLLVLRDCPDWHRALVLDYDQIVLTDLAELFDMDLGGALLAGRLWHRTLGEAAREWFGRQLPPGWRHCEGYPFFYMGPLIDLQRARTAGLWEKILAFHEEAGMEEQIALTVASAGRIKPLPERWNLVPQWDAGAGPGAVIHFTGPRKPWHHPAIPAGEYWQQQQTTWEEIKQGAGQTRNRKRSHNAA